MLKVVRNFTRCPTADELFEEFAEATHQHVEAAQDLSTLTGQHEAFAEALKIANEKRLKSREARLALQRHLEEHRCRGWSEARNEASIAAV